MVDLLEVHNVAAMEKGQAPRNIQRNASTAAMHPAP